MSRTYRGQAPEQRVADRRARLLDAGLDLLGTQGWRATTVSAVCERARLTPRYFYESFRDRDELLVAIFDSVIDDITREVVAAAPAGPEEFLRATVTAFVTMADDDPAKGRATFVEAMGSEALMKRRFERMHWFADQLAHQVTAGRRPTAAQARRVKAASLVAAGGLIELIVAWLGGEITATPGQIIDDYTRAAAAALTA